MVALVYGAAGILGVVSSGYGVWWWYLGHWAYGWGVLFVTFTCAGTLYIFSRPLPRSAVKTGTVVGMLGGLATAYACTSAYTFSAVSDGGARTDVIALGALLAAATIACCVAVTVAAVGLAYPHRRGDGAIRR